MFIKEAVVGYMTERRVPNWVVDTVTEELKGFIESLSGHSQDAKDKQFYDKVRECVEQLWTGQERWERTITGSGFKWHWYRINMRYDVARQRIRDNVRPWLEEARKLNDKGWWKTWHIDDIGKFVDRWFPEHMEINPAPVVAPRPPPEEESKDTWVEARTALVKTVIAINQEYRRLVWRFFSGSETNNGNILNTLGSLDYDLKKVFRKKWDTYHCCLALHYCTKYLPCDDTHKQPTHYGYGLYTTYRSSKDDRFKGVYENNYHFRRRWVAFLKQIVEYVLLINEDNTGGGLKLYEDITSLKAMFACDNWFNGYDWAMITGHIETAQRKIDEEPTTAPLSNYAPFDWYRGVLLEGDDGTRREVTELLEELGKIRW